MTIGKKITFANADPMPVSGIGLVVGLDGTGGGAPVGPLRTMLENHLRQQGYEHIKEILDSNTTSLVAVSGMLAPGSKKGDLFDVDVSVPRECKTSSLRGGKLVECPLYNYASKRAIDPAYKGPDGGTNLIGHTVATVQGQLIVGFGGSGNPSELRSARIDA